MAVSYLQSPYSRVVLEEEGTLGWIQTKLTFSVPVAEVSSIPQKQHFMEISRLYWEGRGTKILF